jgi:hypothetical protein
MGDYDTNPAIAKAIISSEPIQMLQYFAAMVIVERKSLSHFGHYSFREMTATDIVVGCLCRKPVVHQAGLRGHPAIQCIYSN